MIYISIGHNPIAKGACHDGVYEYDEACRWAELVYGLSLQQNLEVKVVPTGSLKQKVSYINAGSSDLAIEIHFNSDVSKKAKGSESLIHPRSKGGLAFAEIVQKEFRDSGVFNPDRGVKEGWYHGGSGQRKLLYFLAKTSCPAVIIEPEFIYNYKTLNDYRVAGCQSIVDALYKYVHGQSN